MQASGTKLKNEVSEHLSDDEDALTFLSGIQTSSGRMVKVVIRALMRTVYCGLSDLCSSYAITL